MITAIVGSPTRTNVLLRDAWRSACIDARVLWPHEVVDVLVKGDVALFRLDVLPTLDGVEPGLDAAEELERRGVRVLNSAAALLATHDKLITTERLAAAHIPHPSAIHLDSATLDLDVPIPCIVKPRFGSWGEDVHLCRTRAELEATLRDVSASRWFKRHGAIVQELIGPERSDLRLVVAGQAVVAAGERTAAPHEWRTNVSLGGLIRPASPPADAREMAVRAADAIGIDFAGVDLLPLGESWVVLELNGAVDFDRRYALEGVDPFSAILAALDLDSTRRSPQHERLEAVMAKTTKGRPPRAGDEIVITGHAVGDAPRTALIMDVLGEPGHERFHVRWEDGHESIYFPADDAVIRPAKRRREAKAV
jgi:gamma-F420-2:alpha-L-glutamate ligase